MPYNDEPIVLTKAELISILDNLKHVWIQRGRIKNAKHLLAIEGFKLALWSISDNELEVVMQLIIKFIDKMRYENFKASKLMGAKTFSKIKSEWLNDPKRLSVEIFGI